MTLAGQTTSSVVGIGVLDVSTVAGGLLRTQDRQESDAVDLLATLIGSRIDAAVATAAGGLVVRLDQGARHRVDRSARFESWSMVGPAGEMVVSMPGGELATWR